MEEKTFNLLKWFTGQLDKEKEGISRLNEKIDGFKQVLKLQLIDLKDDSHYLVPIINGLHGDSMAEKGHPALVNMSFRYQYRDIKIEQLKDFYNFSNKKGKFVVLVHGLMNDDSIWHSEPNDLLQRMGSFLEKQDNANILYIRYNTGRHISENGRDFSLLLQNLFDTYKSGLNELIIIAHSMGGLVTRSAGYFAEKLGLDWISVLKKVFLVGVPNDGSYLARIAHMTQYFFRKLDLTENDKIARLFDIRSNGIKDLSFGFLVDEDWKGQNYETQKSKKAKKVYPIPDVEYYLIGASVSENKEKKKIFTFFGDGLVEKESALSELFKEKQIQSGMIHFKLFDNENHLSLLESEKVKDYVIDSLGWKQTLE